MAAEQNLRAFFQAMQFLTVIPVPRRYTSIPVSPPGLMVLWYPAVGLVLGLLLTVVAGALVHQLWIAAVLVVALWALLTGALHLDGLADSADAWLGGVGDSDRTLRLMQDPRCGAAAVVTLVLLLCLKIAALASLLSSGSAGWLWTVPVFARLYLLPLFYFTPYVREGGLGAQLIDTLPGQGCRVVFVLVHLVLFILLPVQLWFWQALASVIVCLLLRRLAIRRLGGFSGDIAGAQVELCEAAVLVVAAVLLSASP